MGSYLGHGEASLAELDGRGENTPQVDSAAAKSLHGINPACCCTRHSDGVGARQRDSRVALVVRHAEALANGAKRVLVSCAAGAVHGLHLLVRGVPEQHEHVATDSCGARLRHVEAGGWTIHSLDHGSMHGGTLDNDMADIPTATAASYSNVMSAHSLLRRKNECLKLQSRGHGSVQSTTYSCVASSPQHLEATFGSKRLCACDDSLGAVDDAPSGGESEQIRSAAGGGAGRRHGDEAR